MTEPCADLHMNIKFLVAFVAWMLVEWLLAKNRSILGRVITFLIASVIFIWFSIVVTWALIVYKLKGENHEQSRSIEPGITRAGNPEPGPGGRSD